MTLSWPSSSTASRRCAVSDMALTPSSQQLMSRIHPKHVTTISSSACRTLVFSSILGRRSGKGNANYLPGIRYGNQLSFTTTPFADLQHRPFELLHPQSRTVVVTGAYREKGTIGGKHYTQRGRFTGTWIQVNGAWLCVASQSTLTEK